MKKLTKFLIALISVLPLICSAQTNEETKWRWYTLIEDEITYVSEVEDICEDFIVDKNNYILGDWIYSKEKPEEKDYREIIKETKDVSFNRNEISFIEITSFGRFVQEISELTFYDKDNNVINYKMIKGHNKIKDYENIYDGNELTFIETNTLTKIWVELDKVINIRDLKIVMKYKDNNPDFKGLEFNTYLNLDIFTNAYADYSCINNIECIDGLCTLETKVIEDQIYENDIVIKLPIYKYRDKMYKCYKTKKLYVPGYHTYLENYIKDEEDFIIETLDNITDDPELSFPFEEYYKGNLPDFYTIKEIANFNDELNSNEILDKEEKENKQISMVVKNNKDEKANKTNNIKVYIFLIILLVLLSIPVLIKKVKKSRAK